jgi:hypothetical protein
MATPSNYFLDAPTLSGATAVFTDSTLSTPSPDGYYSDGTIVRQQVGGLLQAGSIDCPSCAFPCNQTINVNSSQGIYDIDFSMGTDIGAVIIYFNPSTAPDGIRVLYDSATYNEMTSENLGYLASTDPNSFTYVGLSAEDCNIGTTLDGGGYSGIQEYEWNVSTGVFDNVGSGGVVTGTSADVKLTATSPGWCTLYYPKTASTPETGLLEIFSTCDSAIWDVEIHCPIVLMGVPGRIYDGLTECEEGRLDTLYFNVPNHGGAAGNPQVNEFLCLDQYGINKAPANDYSIEVGGVRKRITVNADGVITAIGPCT